MPQPDYEPDIQLNHFLLSKEWQAIIEILNEAKKDHIAICCDSEKGLEAIRFSQGALAAIESFYDIPNRIFKGEVDNGKYNK